MLFANGRATLFYGQPALRAEEEAMGVRVCAVVAVVVDDVGINRADAGDLTISWFTPSNPKQPSSSPQSKM